MLDDLNFDRGLSSQFALLGETHSRLEAAASLGVLDNLDEVRGIFDQMMSYAESTSNWIDAEAPDLLTQVASQKRLTEFVENSGDVISYFLQGVRLEA